MPICSSTHVCSVAAVGNLIQHNPNAHCISQQTSTICAVCCYCVGDALPPGRPLASVTTSHRTPLSAASQHVTSTDQPERLMHIGIQLYECSTVQHKADIASDQSKVLMAETEPWLGQVPVYGLHPAERVLLAAENVFVQLIEQLAGQKVLNSLCCWHALLGTHKDVNCFDLLNMILVQHQYLWKSCSVRTCGLAG